MSESVVPAGRVPRPGEKMNRQYGAWECGDADNSVYFRTAEEAVEESRSGVWGADVFVRQVQEGRGLRMCPLGNVYLCEDGDPESLVQPDAPECDGLLFGPDLEETPEG